MPSPNDRRLSLDDKNPDLKYRRTIRNFAQDDRNQEKLPEVMKFAGLRHSSHKSNREILENYSYQEKHLETLRKIANFIQTLQFKKPKTPGNP